MIVKKNPLLHLPSHPQTHHGANLGYSYTKTCTSTAKDWKPLAVMGTAVTSWREKLEMSYSRSVTTEKVSRLSGFQIHSLFPLSCLSSPSIPCWVLRGLCAVNCLLTLNSGGSSLLQKLCAKLFAS